MRATESSRRWPKAPRIPRPIRARRAPTIARGWNLRPAASPANLRRGDQVRDVEHARPTVTAMGKKKTPLRFDGARARSCRAAARSATRLRAQRGPSRGRGAASAPGRCRSCGDRASRRRRVRFRRSRSPARRGRRSRGSTRAAAMGPLDVARVKPAAPRFDCRHAGAELHPNAALARQRHQPVAHVARPIRFREQLAGLFLERERDVQVVFEEARAARGAATTCSMPRMRCAGESVTKRSGARTDGRMLQRPPPLMRIFRPPSGVRSMSRTSAPRDAAKSRRRGPRPRRRSRPRRHRVNHQGASTAWNRRDCDPQSSNSRAQHSDTGS